MNLVLEIRDMAIGGGALVVAIGAILFFIKTWIVTPIIGVIDSHVASGVERGAAPIIDRLDEMDEKLRDIQHEVNFNDGRSLKDAVRDTRECVGRLSTKFDIYTGDIGANEQVR